MIKKDNDRITITLRKSLLKQIKRQARLDDTSLSNWIQHVIIIYLGKKYKYVKTMSERDEEQLSRIIEIAKTPWLED